MMETTPHMPPALSNKGLATILSVVSGLAWAGAPVAGPYLGDTYGQVRFRAEDARVIGTATGGPCRFEPDTEVITGEMQGNVLVAQVLLCQEGGAGCEAQVRQPALVIYNPKDRVLSAMIRLREGCKSPALQDNRALVLRATAPQEGGEEEAKPKPEVPKPAAGGALAPSPDAGGSAALVAQERQREPPEVLLLKEAQQQLAEGHHAAAQKLFSRVLEKDTSNLSALVGLAASQLGLGDTGGALKTLERARMMSPRPDVHLWLAYAHLKDRNRRKAQESLRKALDLGWRPTNRPTEAAPEAALREDIEALLQQRARKRTQGRDSTGSGSPSP
jgi:tetratricopeptide (TPR) repeat protein